jgi:hypothetical protein
VVAEVIGLGVIGDGDQGRGDVIQDAGVGWGTCVAVDHDPERLPGHLDQWGAAVDPGGKAQAVDWGRRWRRLGRKTRQGRSPVGDGAASPEDA